MQFVPEIIGAFRRHRICNCRSDSDVNSPLMFLSPLGERLGEGVVATAKSCGFCARHCPLTPPLPRCGGEEHETVVSRSQFQSPSAFRMRAWPSENWPALAWASAAEKAPASAASVSPPSTVFHASQSRRSIQWSDELSAEATLSASLPASVTWSGLAGRDTPCAGSVGSWGGLPVGGAALRSTSNPGALVRISPGRLGSTRRSASLPLKRMRPGSVACRPSRKVSTTPAWA